MDAQLVQIILDAGKEAAYSKAILEMNNGLVMADPRTLGFSDLQNLSEHEVLNLVDEILKAIKPSPISEELLNAIRVKAGDVVYLASGIVAKCDQELNRIRQMSEPSLFDDAVNK